MRLADSKTGARVVPMLPAAKVLALGGGVADGRGTAGLPPMIGTLLGHRQVQAVARYAHPARESVKASATRVAESIAVDM